MPERDPLPDLVELQHLRLIDDGPAMEIAMVCAVADAAVIGELAARAGLRGTRLVSGIDRDPEVLRDAVAHSAAPTLFVLCRTPALDAAQARRAVECFGARRILQHRLLVAQLDPRRPGAWISAVQRAAGSMREAQAVLAAYAGAEGMVDSTAADVARGETRVRRVTPAKATPRPAAVLVGSVPTRDDGDRIVWREDVGPIPAHVRAPGRRRANLSVVDPRETADDGPASISDAVLVLDPPAQPAASPSAATTTVGRVPDVSSTRAARLVAIGVVVLVVLGFAVAPVLGAPRDAARAPVAGIAPLLRPAPSPSATPPVEVVAAPIVVPPTEPSPSEPALQRAVEEGRVGRLEGLYVVAGPDQPLDWYAAANTCRSRSVDGTRGFRLPSIDELRWLRRRDLVPADRALWSGTRVFGRSRRNWVLTEPGGIATQDKRDDAAHVACVRGH